MSGKAKKIRATAKQKRESANLIETLKAMGARELVTYDPETGEPRRTFSISLGTRNVIPRETTSK